MRRQAFQVATRQAVDFLVSANQAARKDGHGGAGVHGLVQIRDGSEPLNSFHQLFIF